MSKLFDQYTTNTDYDSSSSKFCLVLAKQSELFLGGGEINLTGESFFSFAVILQGSNVVRIKSFIFISYAIINWVSIPVYDF